MKHLRQLKDNRPMSDEFRNFVLTGAWTALLYLPCICFQCLMFFVRYVDDDYHNRYYTTLHTVKEHKQRQKEKSVRSRDSLRSNY